MAGRNPHPAAIFFVFFRKAPSDGRFRGAFSDEEGEERQQPAELAQGGGHVAFDGFDAEVEPLGDLLVGKLFVTAQAENPAALFGHAVHGDGDEQRQFLGLDFLAERSVAPLGGRVDMLLHVFVFYDRVGKDVEYGVAGHRVEVAPQRACAAQFAALLPDAQEDVLRDVFRFAGVFKQPEHEFPDLGSIKQVEGIECGLVPFGQSGQQFFFFFRSHSLTQN